MSGSDKKCCVPGCFEDEGSHQVLHRFPNPNKDRNRFNDWVMSIGGDILSLTNEHIHKYRRVCNKHFPVQYLCRYGRISNIAVPTLNLPAFTDLSQYKSVQRKPLMQIQNISEIPSTSQAPMEISKIISMEKISTAQTMAKKPSPETSVELTKLNTNETNCLKEDREIPSTSQGSCNNLRRYVAYKKSKMFITPIEQKLLQRINIIKTRISKYKNTVKKQRATLKAAKNLVTNPGFIQMMEGIPSAAKLLTLLQFREYKKTEKGRRFSVEEKILALSILKQSPKGYRFLRKLLILPSPQTLIKMLNKANINPGINVNIFTQLSKKSSTMKVEDRLCVLLFDEMSLNANITYNERKEEVIGFVSNGHERQSDFADHAQVFMVRGVLKNYKQPVAYTFSSSATKGPELAKQIKLVITNLQKAGFIVIATICDQGTNNRNAIKILIQETHGVLLRQGIEPRHNSIIINDAEIVPLYDPPHLLKCIRNNLLTKDLTYTFNAVNGTAKWDHIEMLLKENPGYKNVRLIPKLTEKHVIRNIIPKMKVKYASKIFSKTVASNMGYLADKKILPSECKETADLILFFDNLFDSVNGSFGKKGRHGKPLLGPVTPNSIHNKVWNEAKMFLKSMKFINRLGKVESVPTLNNWVWTLDGIQMLLKNLDKKYSIRSVWMRHLNQDPIENFFGVIRNHGCRNNNPTPQNFESAYISALINNLSSVHAPGTNCEKDFCQSLYTLVIPKDCKDVQTCDVSEIPIINFTPLNEKKTPNIIGPLIYVAGYFARESKKKIFKGCIQCVNDIINKNELEYIKYREYTSKRWLCSPSEAMIECTSNLQDIFDIVLRKHLLVKNIKCFVKTVIHMLIDFDFINCKYHRDNLINFICNLSSRFFIHNYCKNLNKILNGKINCDNYEDVFQIKAKKHFHKCVKRKRL